MKNIKTTVFLFVLQLFLLNTFLVFALAPEDPPKKFQNITLETSLKPFKENSPEYIKKVAEHMFTQWQSLLIHADTVSIMLWTSDGSEILDYSGILNQPLEWAKYIGNPNTDHEVGSGPKELSLHERAYLYMDNPPQFTYADLKFIVQTLRETGERITGRPVKLGATFDPGPEFAKSEFKYKKHPEILEGNAMGHKTFVSCYSLLNEDKSSYAGFPDGIPDKTPFGIFFGRQSEHFLKDLGFNFLWLSNGFGFGVEPWSSTGVVFTGSGFLTEKLKDTKDKIMGFWTLFRQECSDFEIQTRGSNLSTGIDLARDGVDLRGIYNGNFNILPPPNSPWAAIDGDFGLEMVGYMSHIAELPDNRYVYRFYTHDPWWLNSPWLDRYGRQPHDIYMPMAVSRIDAGGEIGLPTTLNFLSIDNSFGGIPDVVPNEVIPHVLRGREDSPTAPGPLVWVYPFDEYHNWANTHMEYLPEIYYGDWFIRQAINEGFPLNTITSTTSFQKAIHKKPDLYKESIIVTIVPDKGSDMERVLMSFIKRGGKVIVYGPADRASKGFKKLLNLENLTPLEGVFEISNNYNIDKVKEDIPSQIRHTSLFSGGGMKTKIADKNDPCTKVRSSMVQNGQVRDQVWMRSLPEWKGGKVVYIRGTNSSSFQGGILLKPDNPKEWFIAPKMMRYLLKDFDFEFAFQRNDVVIKSPMIAIARSDNGFFFSGYSPNTTVVQKFKFPQGAPVIHGYDSKLENGMTTYQFPTAWHNEARIFIEQKDGIVSSKEMHSGELGISRRISVTGLKDATVRIYPNENVSPEDFKAYLNAGYPWKTGQQAFEVGDVKYGYHFIVKNVTGNLVVAW